MPAWTVYLVKKHNWAHGTPENNNFSLQGWRGRLFYHFFFILRFDNNLPAQGLLFSCGLPSFFLRLSCGLPCFFLQASFHVAVAYAYAMLC